MAGAPLPKVVIVVGAGIVGASVAWHLAMSGATVTIIDAAEPGGVATSASFAWINATSGNPPAYVRLRMRSMAEWTRLAAECPGIPLSWCGGPLWDLAPDELEAFATERNEQGYPIRIVGRDGAARIEPALVAWPERAVHAPGEGVAEPVAAAQAIVADATARGAVLLARTIVRAIDRSGRRVAVDTDRGRLEADAVVIAAGVASPAIAATANIELALDAPPGLLVHSKPHPKLLHGVVLAEDLHMRQTAEGRLVAGADFGGGDPGEHAEATARALFAAMKAMLRGAEGLAYERYSVGRRPTPKDGYPVVGEAAPGIYLAVTHSGVTLAPAIGRFLAEEIMEGRREPLLEPYRPDRFAYVSRSSDRTRLRPSSRH
ncbi:MAG: NAD(P)/FAD-dependent oxidoreductase [Rhizobiaceae bacterium]